MITSSTPAIAQSLATVFEAAAARLREVDPEFVATLQTAKKTQDLGLKYPGESLLLQMVPKQRLSKEWHSVLEHTQSVYQLFELWNYIARQISDIDPTDQSAIVSFRLLLRSWITEGMAIVEHLRGWIDAAVLVANGTQKHKRGIKLRVRQRLNALARGKGGPQSLESARVIQFHGLIDDQEFRAITEDGQWETSLALGMTPERLQGDLTSGETKYLTKWLTGHPSAHSGATEMFSEIVHDAVSELGWAGGVVD